MIFNLRFKFLLIKLKALQFANLLSLSHLIVKTQSTKLLVDYSKSHVVISNECLEIL